MNEEEDINKNENENFFNKLEIKPVPKNAYRNKTFTNCKIRIKKCYY